MTCRKLGGVQFSSGLEKGFMCMFRDLPCTPPPPPARIPFSRVLRGSLGKDGLGTVVWVWGGWGWLKFDRLARLVPRAGAMQDSVKPSEESTGLGRSYLACKIGLGLGFRV